LYTADLEVKKGNKWTLKARYSNRTLRFFLSSNNADYLNYGLRSDDPALNEVEWERLAKWVEYQRAEEKLRGY
jgi:hypothetical protein